MSKKKLSFYDAFKTPIDPDESTPSASQGSNLSGHVAYTPGDELTLRPKPKNINTAYHSAGRQNIEVRAKGSSIPPGAASQWQQPKVNHGYLKDEPKKEHEGVLQPSARNAAQKNEETNLLELSYEEMSGQKLKSPSSTKKVSGQQPGTLAQAQPVSYQSETMPYLDPKDLETQNIPMPDSQRKKQQFSNSELPSANGLAQLTPPVVVSILVIWVISLLFVYFIGKHAGSGDGNAQIVEMENSHLQETIQKQDEKFESRHELTDVGIDPATMSNKKGTEKADLTSKDKEKATPVDKSGKTYTIRIASPSSMERANIYKEMLEKDGFSPVFIIKGRKGILMTVGEFSSSSEANPLRDKLRVKKIHNYKPFHDAYVAEK